MTIGNGAARNVAGQSSDITTAVTSTAHIDACGAVLHRRVIKVTHDPPCITTACLYRPGTNLYVFDTSRINITKESGIPIICFHLQAENFVIVSVKLPFERCTVSCSNRSPFFTSKIKVIGEFEVLVFVGVPIVHLLSKIGELGAVVDKDRAGLGIPKFAAVRILSGEGSDGLAIPGVNRISLAFRQVDTFRPLIHRDTADIDSILADIEIEGVGIASLEFRNALDLK